MFILVGAEGKVEESMELMKEVEDLKVKKKMAEVCLYKVLVFNFQELSKLSVGTHVQVSSIEMILTDEPHLTYITNFVTVEKKREILSFDRIQSLQTHHGLNSFRLLFCNLFNCSAPKRITSLPDFHPQVKWNLFHYRKNVW